MQKIQKFALAMVLISLFTSCQTAPGTDQLLSNAETKKGIIKAIANDREMSKEMVEAMMNNPNGKMEVQANHMKLMGDHAMMVNMMKNTPGMMTGMMSDMMECCKGDSSMMSGMCNTMMSDQKMMDMMQKMKGEKKDMKKMGGM